MNQTFLPVERIKHLIDFESFALFGILFSIAYLFYFLFLKKISEKRHNNMKKRFKLTSLYFFSTAFLTSIFWLLTYNFEKFKPTSYLAVLILILAVISVIKLFQVFLYIYLFFMNMSVGVPRLITNIFSLLFSLVIISWIAADVFRIQLVAVLATSAIFSLVLGLALQDTLGNLFSGLAFQFDRPFNIGDWIEIHSGSDRWSGQVQEINWRATTLMGFADELILIPNRLIASSQLINYSHQQKPARLNQVFRFRFDVSIESAKAALIDGLAEVPGILTDPPPRTLVTEITESWVTIKIFYSLQDYGMKYRTGDIVISKILDQIRSKKLNLANPTLHLVGSNPIKD